MATEYDLIFNGDGWYVFLDGKLQAGSFDSEDDAKSWVDGIEEDE